MSDEIESEEDFDFNRPQRQEPIGIIIFFLDNLRTFANIFIAFIAGSLVKPEFLWVALSLGFAGFIAMAVLAYFQYQRFTFHIEKDELVINEGVFQRDKTNIPFERIQAVHLHQNLFQRILDLTGVKIETAGSKMKELEIKSLENIRARKLQSELRERLSIASEENFDDNVDAENEQKEKKQEERVELVKLSIPQLLVVAITENHIRNGMIALAIVLGYISQINELFGGIFTGMLEENAESIQPSKWQQGILVFIILFVVVSVLISMAKVILKFFDLRADISHKSVNVVSGLLKRNEYNIPLRKVQFIEWYSNIIRRAIGFDTIKIYQGQSHEISAKKSVEITACFDYQSKVVMEHLYQDLLNYESFATWVPHRIQQVFHINIFALPVLIGCGVAYYFLPSQYWIYGFMGYLSIVIFMAKKYYHSVKVYLGKEGLVVERGWLFPEKVMVQWYKLQAVELRQNIFQRRTDTADLFIHTAAGDRLIRFFPKKKLQYLYNFMSYKIESHKGSWM